MNNRKSTQCHSLRSMVGVWLVATMAVATANGQESAPQTAKDSKLLPHLAEWLNADKVDHVGPNFFSVFPECIHPVREQLANDPHRPGYHYLPPTGKAWDVNGPIQFDGRYHLFYQYHTGWALLSGLSMSWGHAVSDDMVHWKDLPIALTPQDENGPYGYETAGIYSGSTVIHDGVPTIFYSSPRTGGKISATSHDGMVTWQRHPDNPVIPERTGGVRMGLDVTVWWDDDDQTWYALIGGFAGDAQNDAGQNVGTSNLFQSDDLVNWKYLNPLFKGKDPTVTGEQWDLLGMFKLGDKHVVLTVAYDPPYLRKQKGFDHFDMTRHMGWIGRFENHRFIPETEPFTLDPGGYFGIAMCFEDDKDRLILMGISWDGNSPIRRKKAWYHKDGRTHNWEGYPLEWWQNIIALPRVLTLRPDGTLGQEPIEELQTLRRKHWRYDQIAVPESGSHFLPEVEGDMLEIIAVIDPGDADAVGIKVLCSPDRQEQTLFIYDRKQKTLTADQSNASLDPDSLISRGSGAYPNLPKYTAKLELSDDELLKLHVFVDRSIVEVFPNKRYCMTQRVYPIGADSTGIDVFSHGGNATLVSLDAWQLNPIWPVTKR